MYNLSKIHKQKHLAFYKFILIQKQKNKCAYCGVKVNRIHGHKRQATLDHIYPKSLGGTNDLKNLQVLCHDCNNKKADTVTQEVRP